ncbi:MAG TPA: exo-beta-N-acetylmuramidase NamZ domain-containing protein [Microlunatus sp.]
MSGTIGRRGLLIGGSALAATPVIGRTEASARSRGDRVRTGADVVAAEDWREFRGQRVGVITNPTGVLSGSLISVVDAMVASGVAVGGVFGPEHGFRGAAQAGSSEDTYVDERTGVTVYDAYGADATTFARLFAEANVQT